MRALVLALALAVAGCGGGPELRRYQEQALAVTALYAPQLDALVGRCDGLAQRVAAVPAEVPGQPALAARLADRRAAVVALRGTLGELPAATAAAIARGARGPVVALVSRTSSDVAAGLVQAGDALAVAERDVVALEAQARALAPPPPAPAAPVVLVPAAPPVRP